MMKLNWLYAMYIMYVMPPCIIVIYLYNERSPVFSVIEYLYNIPVPVHNMQETALYLLPNLTFQRQV